MLRPLPHDGRAQDLHRQIEVTGKRGDDLELLIILLAKNRDVIGWGSEGVGTDAGQAFKFSPPFPCHSTMHGSNKFGLASLTNLDLLPPTGAVIVVAPLKLVDGTGSPSRIYALV